MAENNGNSTNNNNNTNNNGGNRSNPGRNHRNNHGRNNHHRNNSNNNEHNITKFTLGDCEVEGKKYEFRYNNGTYSIVLLKDEENFDLILTTKDKDEAYPEWNKIKRPDKKK